MAKGAAMLAPALATMLVVLTTDADVAASDLDKALRDAVRTTFDRLDSDGCMSTNDTVLLLASGASGVQARPWTSSPPCSRDACDDLAHQLLLDAEGATKAISVQVVGACQRGRRGRRRPGRRPVEPGQVRDSRRRTRTGAGCWPPSARPAPAFDADELNVAINGVWVCENGAAAAGPVRRRPVGPGT